VNGKWPDSEVNYTTGCAAQRANWPASAHWSRISTLRCLYALCSMLKDDSAATMVAAYHGGAPGGGQWVNDAGLRQNISSAMDYVSGFVKRMFLRSRHDCSGSRTTSCRTTASITAVCRDQLALAAPQDFGTRMSVSCARATSIAHKPRQWFSNVCTPATSRIQQLT
jgi:hypothetical protein